jgi:heme/copper-type cytochrome/quinol oxidase subunit 2
MAACKSSTSYYCKPDSVLLLTLVILARGLKLAQESLHILIIYAIVTVAVALVLVTVYGCIIYRRRRLRRKEEDTRENSEIILANYWGVHQDH